MTDFDRPRAHLRPPAGWLNDPNGPVRWKGRWHVFFQHNPAGPEHGAICWGHASSADLATWVIEPVALTPTAGGPDAAGCWSGCVVDDGGVATAVYTGLGTEDPLSAAICLARSADDDLRSWVVDPVPVAAPPPGTSWAGYRDPFLFTFGGRRYAVVGAGSVDAGAAVLLYDCEDLRRWTYLGTLLDLTDPVAASVAPAEIWECPQLARLGDRWVLVVSSVVDDRLGRVAYLVGDLHPDGEGLRFVASGGDLLDHGHDFYAAALLVEDDRVLAWGWSWEDREPADVVASGWAGVLTWPRSLALSPDGRVVTAPATEMARLRLDSVDAVVDEGSPILLPEGPVDVELVVPATARVSLRLGGPVRQLTISLDVGAGKVSVHRDVHEPYRRAWVSEGTFPPGREEVAVRLVVDGALVELHVDDGPTFTERLHATGVERELRLMGEGRARATLHRLASAVG